MSFKIGQVLNRSFYTLIKGTTLAQLFAFIIYPVLTRLYLPSEFGEKSIFIALLNVLVVFASLSYEVAIPITPEKSQAKAIALGSLVLACAISLLIFLVILLSYSFFNTSFSEWYIWLIPPGIILGATFKIGIHYSIREEWFNLITQTRIIRSIGRAGVELVGGVLKWGSIGLILAYLIGFLGGVILFGSRIYNEFSGWFKDHVFKTRYKEIIQAFADFKSFPVSVSLANIFHLLSLQLPIYFLAQYSTEWVGQFNLAMLGVNTGAVVLLDAFSQIYLSGLRKQSTQNKQFLSFFQLTFSRILILGFIPAFLMYLLGPKLLPLIMGEKWLMAGQLCTITAWLLPAMFFHNLGFHTFNQLKRPYLTLLADAMALFFTVAMLWFEKQQSPNLQPAGVLSKYVIIINFFYLGLAIISIWQYYQKYARSRVDIK